MRARPWGAGAPTGAAGTTAGGSGSANDLPDVEPAAASCAGLAGTWTGYLESFSIAGSDAVTITMTPGDTCVRGQMQFGNAPPLPPATDPEVGYPAGIANPDVFTRPVQPGFAYSLRTARLDAKRLRTSIDRLELWGGWCALQKPVVADWGLTGYGCLPNWGWQQGLPDNCGQPEPQTGKLVVVDCGKLQLCAISSVCSCTAQSCTTVSLDDVKLDVVFAGDALDGSIAGLSSVPVNVHLSRQK